VDADQLMLTLLGFILPLSLDTFAVAFTVLGPGGLTSAQRRRFTVLLVAFEAGMPLLGFALGAPLAHLIGGPTRFLAPAAAAAVGIWFLRDDDDDDDDDDDGDDDDGEARKAKALVTARGLTAVGLGLSISLDELAVGFSIGFSKQHPVIVVSAIAVQAFLAIQLGAYLGARLAGRYRDRRASQPATGPDLVAVSTATASSRTASPRTASTIATSGGTAVAGTAPGGASLSATSLFATSLFATSSSASSSSGTSSSAPSSSGVRSSGMPSSGMPPASSTDATVTGGAGDGEGTRARPTRGGPVEYWLRQLDGGGRHRLRRPPSARIREGSERMAGISLLVLSAFLFAEPFVLN
jgi:putative Mn2+ efflux pump MntP